ncbi:MAG: MinD/ParA family protein [Vicinamibacterales bacterium]
MKPIAGPPHRAAILAITSGKGGVGKTSLTVNVAAALARSGHRVGVLDADLGLGNVDVMLGLTPGAHLGDVLGGEKTLPEIMVRGPEGISVIPAGNGIRALTTLSGPQWQRLAEVVDEASAALDYLLVDTAPGVSDNVIGLAALTDRVIVVTSYEPTAIVDAYAAIKLLMTAEPHREVGVVVNAVRDADQGELVFRQLSTAATRFLGVKLRYYGFVIRDATVGEAVLEQRPVVSRTPDAPASRCFRRLALRVANWSRRPPSPRPAVPAAIVPFSPEDFARLEAPRCA